MMKKLLKNSLLSLGLLTTSFLFAQSYTFDTDTEVFSGIPSGATSTNISNDGSGHLAMVEGGTVGDANDANNILAMKQSSGLIDATTNKFVKLVVQNPTDQTDFRIRLGAGSGAYLVTLANDLQTNNTTTFETREFDLTGDASWTGTFDGTTNPNSVFVQFTGGTVTPASPPILIDELTFSPATTLSTDEFGKVKDVISFYPNPTNNILNIKSVSNVSKISIFDITGKRVLSAEKTNSINMSSLSSGTYITNVLLENGTVSIKRIALNK